MNTRRQFLVNVTMAAGAVSVLRPLQVFAGMGAPTAADSNHLILIHTANLKGQWKALRGSEAYPGLGGLELLQAGVEATRSEGAHVLLVDAGNMVGGRAAADERLKYYKAACRLGYDSIVPGATDLLKGAEDYNRLLEESGLLAAGGQRQGVAGIYDGRLPYRIVNKGNLQIAIVDCGTGVTRRLKDRRHAAEAINKTAGLIKSKTACMLVVCVIQEGFAATARLAAASSDVDIFISSAEHHSVNSTRVLRNRRDEEVILSYSGGRGTMVNRIDFEYREGQEKVYMRSKLLLPGIDEGAYAAAIRKYRLYA